MKERLGSTMAASRSFIVQSNRTGVAARYITTSLRINYRKYGLITQERSHSCGMEALVGPWEGVPEIVLKKTDSVLARGG